MSNILSTLSLARRALLAQQGAMTVVGSNVANVNTPGYARRRAELESAPGASSEFGLLGAGVDLARVRTLRDPFIEDQFRRELSNSNRLQIEYQQLGLVETSLGGLGDDSLDAVLGKFWNAWQDLANDPTSSGQRGVVRESARSLINRFQNIDRSLREQEKSVNSSISSKIERVNVITKEIANLNQTAGRGSRRGDEADDRRTVLLDELVGLTGAEYKIDQNGAAAVYIGGIAVVEGTLNRPLEYNSNADKGSAFGTVGGVNIEIAGGEIAALQGTIKGEISSLHQRLDEVASGLMQAVNRLHRQGYGLDGNPAGDFFDPATTGISDIALSDSVEKDVRSIAASANGEVGDNRLALAIAELADQPIVGGRTLGEALRDTISVFGSRVQEAEVQSEGAQLAVSQIAAWRDSVSGVSLDEEMTDMIKYQHAYNAAAKMITTMNQMMETLVNMQ
ncbi:MAG: flagellar hook-associated protein FlgK [Calditrichota bacterium]